MNAAMAQSVERVLGKDEVGGSNPPSSSKSNPFPKGSGLLFYSFHQGVFAIGGGLSCPV